VGCLLGGSPARARVLAKRRALSNMRSNMMADASGFDVRVGTAGLSVWSGACVLRAARSLHKDG
jgi:hypothetical protein